MASSLLCLMTYAFKDKSISEIILNYKQKIVDVKLSTEHCSYHVINVGAILTNDVEYSCNVCI